MKFDNEQQYNNAYGRQIKLVDESIDALKLSTLLPQFEYNIISIVNIKKTTRLMAKNITLNLDDIEHFFCKSK